MFQEDKADVGLATLQQVQQEGKDMGTEEIGVGWGEVYASLWVANQSMQWEYPCQEDSFTVATRMH